MLRRTRIKICGITNAQDALDAIEAGAEYLGLIFVPETPRALTIEQAKPITEAIRAASPDVRIVGVFQNQPVEIMREAIEVLDLDFAQLHGQESLSVCWSLPVPILKTVILEGAEEDVVQTLRTYLPSPQNNIGALLLDLPKGSKDHIGETALMTPTILALLENRRYFLAGRLQAENVREVVRAFRPWGVDVASGVESRPGQKDPQAMRAFCQAVQSVGAPLPDSCNREIV